MSGQWHADPLGRAHHRYYDGSQWTRMVATNGVQSEEDPSLPMTKDAARTLTVAAAPSYAAPAYAGAPAGYVLQPAGGGKLMAAGVLSIISGSFSLLVALFGLIGASSFQSSFLGQVDEYGNGGSVSTVLYLVVLVIAAIGGGFLWAGIGAVKKRQWGQIAVIALAAVATLFYLIILIASGEAILLISVIWFAVILGLAIFENPRVFDKYRAQLGQHNG